MIEKAKNDLEIYTENEVMQRLVIGRPYRPIQTYILLLKKGSLDVCYNFTHYTLTPSTILLIRAKNVYEFLKVDSDAQFQIITFNRKIEALATIKLRRYGNTTFLTSSIQNHYTVSPYEFLELWNITELLKGRIASLPVHGIKKEIIHHQFWAFIYLWADISGKYNQIIQNELSRPDKLMSEFVKHVSIHFRSEKSVSFYANLLGISSNHLSETIKLNCGFTASEIINTAILTEAKILLSNPANTIKQVSRKLNFSDQYAFSKFFKRLTFKSPSTFRENI
jgi:AraC-like DNA-binding protein